MSYLLARLIVCDHCGSRFVGRRQKKTPKNGGEPYDYFRYYCNGYITKGRTVCQPGRQRPCATDGSCGLSF